MSPVTHIPSIYFIFPDADWQVHLFIIPQVYVNSPIPVSILSHDKVKIIFIWQCYNQGCFLETYCLLLEIGLVEMHLTPEQCGC